MKIERQQNSIRFHDADGATLFTGSEGTVALYALEEPAGKVVIAHLEREHVVALCAWLCKWLEELSDERNQGPGHG